VPESKLKKGKEVATDIKLYPTQKHPGKEARIMRGFKSKE